MDDGAGEGAKEGGWYEIRGEKSNIVVGPDGMSKIELSFAGKIAKPGLMPSLGWLTLLVNGTWTRYFFMLDPYNQMLRYFQNEEDVSENALEALGEFNTRCCKVNEMDTPYQNTLKVETSFGLLVMYADSPAERDTWVDTLREVGNPIGIRTLSPPPSVSNNQASLMTMSPPTSAETIAVGQQTPPEYTPERSLTAVSPTKTVSPRAPASPVVSPRIPASAPLSSDTYEHLALKFEASRLALADLISKNRELEVRVQICLQQSARDFAVNPTVNSVYSCSVCERDFAFQHSCVRLTCILVDA